MIKVLFVCLGNICRSPMAEGVFQQMVKEAGLDDKILVDSAGTAGYHVGEPAHRGTRAILKKHDIPYRGSARKFVVNDLSDFDYVLAMDKSNYANIQRETTRDTEADVRMFLSYANGAGLTTTEEVPDPYYNDNFDEVYDLVRNGSQALLDHIRETHNL